ncbi:zinc-finger protein [Coemansia sp. RSA 1933]|nr:zinc-finger protein [Coemansia sp. RSA 1933]
MADLRLGASDAQEGEEHGASGSDTRLAPLHGHEQGQDSAECESAGCAQPLKLPSLSALGITDTIRTALGKSPSPAGRSAEALVKSLSPRTAAGASPGITDDQDSGSGSGAEAVDMHRASRTGASSSGMLEILAAVSADSASGHRGSKGGLASSVQRCLWSTCTQIFSSIDELVRHLYKLHVATNRASISRVEPPGREQQARHAALEMICKWASCETRARGAEALIDHVCRDHLDAEQVLHRCGWTGCGREFETIDMLTEHLSAEHIGSGHSTYVCRWEGCERAERPFAQRQRALRHIQTHTGAKPFSCGVCTKRFSEAHIMQQHLRVHTGERPFKCAQSGCGKEFAVSSALTIHRRTHTGEKPYECRFDGCVRRFAESSNLTKHMRIHTGERPFKCPQTECGKTFSRPDQVSRHRRIHTGQKPLPCPVDQCNKMFTTPSTRLNHLRSLHPSAMHMALPYASAPAGSEHSSTHSSKHSRLSTEE